MFCLNRRHAGITEATLKKAKTLLGPAYVTVKGQKHPECGWAAIILASSNPTPAQITAAKLVCIQWSEDNLPPLPPVQGLGTPPPPSKRRKQAAGGAAAGAAAGGNPAPMTITLDSPGARAGAAALARGAQRTVIPATSSSA
jgi:hypothetical protein